MSRVAATPVGDFSRPSSPSSSEKWSGDKNGKMKEMWETADLPSMRSPDFRRPPQLWLTLGGWRHWRWLSWFHPCPWFHRLWWWEGRSTKSLSDFGPYRLAGMATSSILLSLTFGFQSRLVWIGRELFWSSEWGESVPSIASPKPLYQGTR